jgi:peptidyl-tRNA hydrolase, PTH1 family
MKFLIVGLGNIGPEYASTRHNIGFMVVDALAEASGAKFDSGRYAFVTEIKHKGKSLTLIKPTTYMNLSGKAVNYWMKELKITPEQVMVIVDDLALPFGKLRMRSKGSSAGHNGLTHIQETLGSDAYPRLRFGIGDNFPKGRQIEYVLGTFDKNEAIDLPTHIDKARDMILSFATVGIARTMTEFND